MAWPIARANGFVATHTAWNEIVNALSAWGGDVNAAGYDLTNVNIIRASYFHPRSGPTMWINHDATFADRYVSMPNQLLINGAPTGGANVKRFTFNSNALARMFIGVQGDEAGANSGSSFFIHSIADDGSTVLRGGLPDLCVIRATGYIGLGTQTPGAPLSFFPSNGDKLALYDNTPLNDVYGLGIGAFALRLFPGGGGAVRISQRLAPGVYDEEFLLDSANRGLIFPLAAAYPFADGALQSGAGYFHWDAVGNRVLFRMRDTGGTLREQQIPF